MSQRLPVVGVLVASPAELGVMQQAGAILEKLDIPHEIRVMSSSRSPDVVDEYARTAFDRGIKVMICTTGISGHLARAALAVKVALTGSMQAIGRPLQCFGRHAR